MRAFVSLHMAICWVSKALLLKNEPKPLFKQPVVLSDAGCDMLAKLNDIVVITLLDYYIAIIRSNYFMSVTFSVCTGHDAQ